MRHLRSAAACLSGLAIALTLSAAPARAGQAVWQLEQPPPPPAPAGVTGVGRPLGLGTIGDIEFWAPNRGLLITGGNPPAIPKGLWAYDGVSWHQLSTVCGSAAGRIAWAGPDDFWTISDPAPNSQQAGLIGDTLCHFVNGQVVASYATPAGSDDPYQQMFAAACNGPDDCWFAGNDAVAPLSGAFHLHWDGNTLTDVLGPEDRTIDGLAAVQGQFFESDLATLGDQPVPAEAAPLLLHRIVPGVGAAQEFAPEPFVPASCAGGTAYMTLGTDGSELWAVGGQTPNQGPPCFSRPPLAARLVNGTFQELGVDTSQFPSGDAFLAVAPEPGGGDAWVSVGPPGASVGEPQNEFAPFPPAEVARIADDGTTREIDTIPAAGSGQPNHGAAGGPIACPGAGDCWMATREGWLYHLTDGTPHVQDTDPSFSALIDVRPPDAGTATEPPDNSPLDDSLANQQTIVVQPKPRPPKPAKPKPLILHMKEALHGFTLQLSFTLTLRSRVTFAALRHGRSVATTGAHVLRPGRHVLSLQLTRTRWPDRLLFKVFPVSTKVKKPR